MWLQLTEEMEKAQSLIDDMSSQLNEVKIRLVSDYHSFSNNTPEIILLCTVSSSPVKLLVILCANVLHLVPKVFLRNGKHTVSSHQVIAACRRLLSIKEG